MSENKDVKNLGGRPSKYKGIETIIQLKELAAQGKFDAAIAKGLGVSSRTLREWSADETKPEFQEAWQERLDLRQAYYEELTRKVISGEEEKFSTAQKDLLVRTLITQFSGAWTENKKTTLEITDRTKEMSDKDLEESIQKKIKQILGLRPDLKVVNDDEDGK